MIRSRSTYGRFRPRATAIRRTADPDRRTAPPAPVILCRRGPAFRRGRRARADGAGPADCRRGCSASDTSGGRGDVRLEQERARVALAGALEIETMEPDRDGRRRPDAPWCSPRQETSAFLRRQLGDTFQVQVDAGLERRDDRRERLAVYGDVEIKADGVPLLAASVGITPQSGHVDSAARRPYPAAGRAGWCRSCQPSMRPSSRESRSRRSRTSARRSRTSARSHANRAISRPGVSHGWSQSGT